MAVFRPDIGIGVVSDIEFIPHPDLHTVEVIDADIYTAAHVNCLAERREARLVRAFFDMAEDLKTHRQVSVV